MPSDKPLSAASRPYPALGEKQGRRRSGIATVLVGRRTYIGQGYQPILVSVRTYIRLLLRVGIKVVDEWQISLDYVRGSNIYVRGYLDLRVWSLRLRA